MRLKGTQSLIKTGPIKRSLTIKTSYSMHQDIKLKNNNQIQLLEKWEDGPVELQEIEEMKMFVEEMSTGKHILRSLIDYTELVKDLKQENQEIKYYIQTVKQQLGKLKLKYRNDEIQHQNIQVRQLQKLAQQACHQTEEYHKIIAIQLNSNAQKRKMKQRKIQELKNQKNRVYLNKKNEQQKIISFINSYRINTKQLSHKMVAVKDKIQALKNKIMMINLDKKKNQLIKQKVNDGIKLVISLKKEQSQVLAAYKSGLQKKKSGQIQMKKGTQKKLNKFVQQITKILESGHQETYSHFVQKYQANNQVRDKNYSSDTKPDQNEEDQARFDKQTTIESLESKYPALKAYSNMQINRLTIESFKTGLEKTEKSQSKIKQNEASLKLAEQSIKKLSLQEADLNSLLQSLYEKIGKINEQLYPKRSNK